MGIGKTEFKKTKTIRLQFRGWNSKTCLLYTSCMKQEVAFRKQNGKDWCMRRLKEMAEDETTLQVLKTYPIKKMEKKQRILFTMILTKNMYVVYWLFRLRYRLS